VTYAGARTSRAGTSSIWPTPVRCCPGGQYPSGIHMGGTMEVIPPFLWAWMFFPQSAFHVAEGHCLPIPLNVPHLHVFHLAWMLIDYRRIELHLRCSLLNSGCNPTHTPPHTHTLPIHTSPTRQLTALQGAVGGTHCVMTTH
jgi:hypothetical protein